MKAWEGLGGKSIINLTLILAKLVDKIVYYGIYLTEYRLDYRAI
jgi:hypothetical protein